MAEQMVKAVEMAEEMAEMAEMAKMSMSMTMTMIMTAKLVHMNWNPVTKKMTLVQKIGK